MKKYVKKKLPNFQVHRVLSQIGNRCEEMRQLREPFVIDGVPEGCFALADRDAIFLPKRRRGEKFIVAYTVMQEKTL